MQIGNNTIHLISLLYSLKALILSLGLTVAAFPTSVNHVPGAMLGKFAFCTTVQWTMASYLNLQYVGFEIMC